MAKRSLGDYLADDLCQSAVERQLEIAGDALGQLRKLDAVLFGKIPDGDLVVAFRNVLAHGYATASTDTGHATEGASFAMGRPEKLVDFGFRAVHEMTIEAKALIRDFNSQPARHSYWNSRSTGGRLGLMEALRFPAGL